MGGRLGPAPDGLQGWGRMSLAGSLPLPGATPSGFRLQVADMMQFTATGQSVTLGGLEATGGGWVAVAGGWESGRGHQGACAVYMLLQGSAWHLIQPSCGQCHCQAALCSTICCPIYNMSQTGTCPLLAPRPCPQARDRGSGVVRLPR